MTYLEEAEKLKAEYKMKISEIENKSETLGWRDSYVSKECHNAMIDFMNEIDKLQKKYGIDRP